MGVGGNSSPESWRPLDFDSGPRSRPDPLRFSLLLASLCWYGVPADCGPGPSSTETGFSWPQESSPLTLDSARPRRSGTGSSGPELQAAPGSQEPARRGALLAFSREELAHPALTDRARGHVDLHQELEHLTNSFAQLKQAQAKFKACATAVEEVAPKNESSSSSGHSSAISLHLAD